MRAQRDQRQANRGRHQAEQRQRVLHRNRIALSEQHRREWRRSARQALRADRLSLLRWSEIDLGSINLPGERTKNKRPHIVPLSPTTRALLEKRPRTGSKVFKFPNWSLCKELLDKRSGVTGWTIHDLRRTTATGMADIGIAPHIIEAVLNHVSGHKGGVAGTLLLQPLIMPRDQACYSC